MAWTNALSLLNCEYFGAFNLVNHHGGSRLPLRLRCQSFRNSAKWDDCTTRTVRCLSRLAAVIVWTILSSLMIDVRLFRNLIYGTSSKSPSGISPASNDTDATSKLQT